MLTGGKYVSFIQFNQSGKNAFIKSKKKLYH